MIHDSFALTICACVDLVLMGFEQEMYVVDEEAGTVSLCVTTTSGTPLQRTVSIDLETSGVSAQS